MIQAAACASSIMTMTRSTGGEYLDQTILQGAQQNVPASFRQRNPEFFGNGVKDFGRGK